MSESKEEDAIGEDTKRELKALILLWEEVIIQRSLEVTNVVKMTSEDYEALAITEGEIAGLQRCIRDLKNILRE